MRDHSHVLTTIIPVDGRHQRAARKITPLLRQAYIGRLLAVKPEPHGLALSIMFVKPKCEAGIALKIVYKISIHYPHIAQFSGVTRYKS